MSLNWEPKATLIHSAGELLLWCIWKGGLKINYMSTVTPKTDLTLEFKNSKQHWLDHRSSYLSELDDQSVKKVSSEGGYRKSSPFDKKAPTMVQEVLTINSFSVSYLIIYSCPESHLHVCLLLPLISLVFAESNLKSAHSSQYTLYSCRGKPWHLPESSAHSSWHWWCCQYL